jgi:hypothetical protein
VSVGSWGGIEGGELSARASALLSASNLFLPTQGVSDADGPRHSSARVAVVVPGDGDVERDKKGTPRGAGWAPARRSHPSEAKRLDDCGHDRMVAPAWSSFPALAKSFRTPRGWTPTEETRRLPPKWTPPILDPSREHAALEELTAPFRIGISMRHVAKAREARRQYIGAIDTWSDALPFTDASTLSQLTDAAASVATDAVSTERWHTCRAQGQLYRFERVRTCGMRTLVATCKTCGEDRRPVRETCDIRRVCESCDVDNAKTRRARFGRARGLALLEGLRYNLFRPNRAGGRFGEKMLTLTVPHLALEDATGELRRKATCTLDARIRALFGAWPRFVRKMNRWWKAHHQTGVRYHRAFEWTLANDGKGHPHFHVYLLSPFVDVALVREWWAEALRAIGCPVARGEYSLRSEVMVDLRVLRVPSAATVRELLKGGKRSAIELSRIVDDQGRPLTHLPGMFAGGRDAFEYADGWTLGEVEAPDDVRAQLYCSLEGRRLTQASRGFFVDDEPPECACCGGREFRVRFEVCEHTQPLDVAQHERGPPS